MSPKSVMSPQNEAAYGFSYSHTYLLTILPPQTTAWSGFSPKG